MGYSSDFDDLVGKTLTKVDNRGDELYFYAEDGDVYKQYHRDDCCEAVWVEEIVGDLDDLVGSPILQAEEVSYGDETPMMVEMPEEYRGDDGYTPESYTWTFYKLATIKGSVTIRWFGTSNGYYSESADFIKVGGDNDW